MMNHGRQNNKYVTFKFKDNLKNYLRSLASSEKVRDDFIKKIISTGYENCYLEFPSFSYPIEQNGEFTITESRKFLPADWSPFNDQLKSLADISIKRKKYAVCHFSNLSGDTLLVCPVPTLNKEIDKHSGHLMDFLKNGNNGQKHELIKMFASEALKLASHNKKSLYISTHGHGVSWLHIRLSYTPKYYTHAIYAK
jgi:hypothetical protein